MPMLVVVGTIVTVLLFLIGAGYGAVFTDIGADLSWSNASVHVFTPFFDQTQLHRMRHQKQCAIGKWSNPGNPLFFGGISTYTYTDSKLRSADDAMRLLSSLGGKYKHIAFIGDSITRQMVDAWRCEWLANSKTVLRSKTVLVRPRYVPEGYVKRIQHTISDTGGKMQPSRVHFDYIFRPSFNKAEDSFDLVAKSGVIVGNYGVHWRIFEQKQYREVMRQVFAGWINRYNSDSEKVFIWRETSEQSFFSIGGEYSEYSESLGVSRERYEAEEMGKSCADSGTEILFEGNITRQWREKIVKEEAELAGFTIVYMGDPLVKEKQERGTPLLYWLPFFQHSMDRRELHPYTNDRKSCDGTHFMYSPHFWAPVTENLVRIIETALAK